MWCVDEVFSCAFGSVTYLVLHFGLVYVYEVFVCCIFVELDGGRDKIVWNCFDTGNHPRCFDYADYVPTRTEIRGWMSQWMMFNIAAMAVAVIMRQLIGEVVSGKYLKPLRGTWLSDDAFESRRWRWELHRWYWCWAMLCIDKMLFYDLKMMLRTLWSFCRLGMSWKWSKEVFVNCHTLQDRCNWLISQLVSLANVTQTIHLLKCKLFAQCSWNDIQCTVALEDIFFWSLSCYVASYLIQFHFDLRCLKVETEWKVTLIENFMFSYLVVKELSLISKKPFYHCNC